MEKGCEKRRLFFTALFLIRIFRNRRITVFSIGMYVSETVQLRAVRIICATSGIGVEVSMLRFWINRYA